MAKLMSAAICLRLRQDCCMVSRYTTADFLPIRIYNIIVSLDRKECMYVYIYNHVLILISSLFKDNEQSLQLLCKNYAEDRARELNHNSDVYQLVKTEEDDGVVKVGEIETVLQ